uniref:thioredoxin fold domain-containing protein n=1 Tax=Cupriavidus taiwanensis TaxID=164546 RepID=UPI003F49A51C
MKISFERKPKDFVRIEPDGSLSSFFAGTGHMKALSRVRLTSANEASLNAFSVASARPGETSQDNAATAPYAIVFVTEDAGEKLRILERFQSHEDAERAHGLIVRAFHRRSFVERLKARLRTLGLYVGVPLLVLGMYSSIATLATAKSQSPELTAAILAEANRIAAPTALPSAPTSNASPVARTDGQISVSPVLFPKGTPSIYVFSDPKCPACRAVEPAIQEIARHQPVVVLPVAYKPGSDEVAVDALCRGDSKQQAAAWGDAMAVDVRGKESTLNEELFQKQGRAPELCAKGREWLEKNRQAFEAMGLTQTPSVVNADGQLLDLNDLVKQYR